MKISPGVNVLIDVEISLKKSFICDIIRRERDRTDHLSEHNKNQDPYITFSLCKVYKHISHFRFK